MGFKKIRPILKMACTCDKNLNKNIKHKFVIFLTLFLNVDPGPFLAVCLILTRVVCLQQCRELSAQYSIHSMFTAYVRDSGCFRNNLYSRVTVRTFVGK